MNEQRKIRRLLIIGSGLSGRWLSAVVWKRLSSAAFCRLEDLCRQADLQQLWGSTFRRCRCHTGPRPWNSLPAGFRQTSIGYVQFEGPVTVAIRLR